MNRFQTFLFLSIFWGLISWSCKEEGRLDHLDMDAPAPAPVTNLHVMAKPGGAVVHYTLPTDQNLAYVKAVYEIRPGVIREAKSSIYADSLELVGFGDTEMHEVSLYSVGKNEKISEAVTASVQPEEPPVNSVFRTLELTETFGGVSVRYANETAAALSIVVMVDTTGKKTWSPAPTFYTGAVAGRFSVRGYAPETKTFAVYVRDRWSNKSDTLIVELTPYREALIPKDWEAVHLETDTWQPVNSGYSVEKLWDNKIAVLQDGFASPNASTLPQWFTIDLKRPVLINRFKMHQAPSSHLYTGSAPKTFELWGSNNPDSDGGWDNWQLLGTFHSFKPSGAPLGTVTPEDKQYAAVDGEDFEFEELPPAVQYIRFKTLETYSSMGQVVLTELTFWGQEQE